MATGSLVSLNSSAKVVPFLLAGVNYSSSFYKIFRFMPRYLDILRFVHTKTSAVTRTGARKQRMMAWW